MAKNKLKKSSQPKLIQLICNLIYEIRITPQKKKNKTNHEAQDLISQC